MQCDYPDAELESCLVAVVRSYYRERAQKQALLDADNVDPALRALCSGLQEQRDELLAQVKEERASARTLETIVVTLPPQLKGAAKAAFVSGLGAYRHAVRQHNRERKNPDGLLLMEAAYTSLVAMGSEMMALSRSEMFSGEQVAVLFGHIAEKFLYVPPEELVGRDLGLPSLAEQKLGISQETLAAADEQRRAKARQENVPEAPLSPHIKVDGFLASVMRRFKR